MRLTTVFNKLASPQGAFVKEVKFEPRCIRLTLRPRSRVHRCPVPGCSYTTAAAYDSSLRSWRAVSLGCWPVYFTARSCRLRCPTHGILHERVAWAAPNSTFTLDFEEIVAWLAKEMNFTAITQLMRISWKAVSNIVERVVSRKLDDTRLNDLYAIGIDEVSYRKGHKYLTVIANHTSGKVLEMAEGKGRDALGSICDKLGAERCSQIRVVSMDMSPAFIAEAKVRFPNAQIVFDRFHVVKLANEALQEVRRAEARVLKGGNNAEFLKGSRWALLKAPENLSNADKLRLADVKTLNSNTYRAYLLKEELRALFDCNFLTAKRHLDAWISWARRSRLEPFKTLAKTIREHEHGILAAVRLPFANGMLEGINNKIKMVQHRAFGFHSVAALIAMVHLVCGDIPTHLPQLPIWN